MLSSLRTHLLPRFLSHPRLYPHFRFRLGKTHPRAYHAIIKSSISEPPTEYIRPTPIVFISGPLGFDWTWKELMQPLFNEEGFMTIVGEVSFPLGQDVTVGEAVEGLRRIIAESETPFPPLLLSHGLHTLLVQKYLESYPATGAVLISPWSIDYAQTLSNSSSSGCITQCIPGNTSDNTTIEERVMSQLDGKYLPQLRHALDERMDHRLGTPVSLLDQFIAHPPLLEHCSETGFPMFAVGFEDGDGVVDGDSMGEVVERYGCDQYIVDGEGKHLFMLDEECAGVVKDVIVEWMDENGM